MITELDICIYIVPCKRNQLHIYNIEYQYGYYYIIILCTSVCPTIILFEYMVTTLLCNKSLHGECAMSACQPAGKMLYKKMLIN